MIKSVSRDQLRRLRRRLNILYGSQSEKLLERIFMMIGRYGIGGVETQGDVHNWDERDSVLITYADSLHSDDVSPLRALERFSCKHLKGAIRCIHLLPFYPWSSDDGFSVIDYREVERSSGSWEDIQHLGQQFDLMFDLVLNHCSARSSWFRDYIAGIEPARHYFIEMDPDTDLSAVVRPRTSPVLTPTRTRDGERYIWTTFSPDQVDLNWENPEVLIEFLDILMLYISKGMRIVRLDAVAFLWKKLGTDCIHLPETHEVVKLFRDVLEIIAPSTILLTETNVPHKENISYFGRGDEAQMVYQFSLPPLLLHALICGNGTHLTNWAKNLKPPPAGCTFFNFTASHDGIGVRPVESLLPAREIKRLISHVEKSGGLVSYRNLSDGSKKPYELNVTYYSALSAGMDAELGARRFLCSQAAMLSLRGIPGVYLHSLTATPNDLEGVEASGINRRINRRKWELPELEEHLDTSLAGWIFEIYKQMLIRRSSHPAFHPDAPQTVHAIGDSLFALTRTSTDQQESVLCLHNLTAESLSLKWSVIEECLGKNGSYHDILSGKELDHESVKSLSLDPYQALWLTIRQ